VPLGGGVPAPAGGDEPAGGDPEGLLPAFLDRLAQLASRERSYLLDPRYAGLVPDPLRPLRDALERLGEVLAELPPDADRAATAYAEAALRAFGWRRSPDGSPDGSAVGSSNCPSDGSSGGSGGRREPRKREGGHVGVRSAALSEIGQDEPHQSRELEAFARVAARQDDPAGQSVEDEAPVG
jgi:hypothetical protein